MATNHWTSVAGSYINKNIFELFMHDKSLVVFQDKKIRRTWFNEEWWFVAVDIIEAITNSKDPSGYLKDMRRRDEGFEKGWGQIATLLLIDTAGGKQNVNCVSVKGAFRLIQSIPSSNAEPFKQWLAQVGYERVQEIENPELAQDRVKKYYELKGYPPAWIEKRLRGIAIRQELTDEWKDRGVKEEKDFAILTNEISTATFGKTVQEYKEFKGLQKKNQNLRDHMNDWELILTMVGEKATTDITVAKNAEGLPELEQTAKEGGEVANITRKEIEKRTEKSVVSDENYLHLNKKKKMKEIENEKNTKNR
jgi:DNA-damage-inducible protein D